MPATLLGAPQQGELATKGIVSRDYLCSSVNNKLRIQLETRIVNEPTFRREQRRGVANKGSSKRCELALTVCYNRAWVQLKLLSSTLRQLGVDVRRIDQNVLDEDARVDLVAFQKRGEHVNAEATPFYRIELDGER